MDTDGWLSTNLRKGVNDTKGIVNNQKLTNKKRRDKSMANKNDQKTNSPHILTNIA